MFGGSEEGMLGGIDITQEMVTKQLSRLRDDKASGPDELEIGRASCRERV